MALQAQAQVDDVGALLHRVADPLGHIEGGAASFVIENADGRMRAPGATRWTIPATMVPWPAPSSISPSPSSSTPLAVSAGSESLSVKSYPPLAMAPSRAGDRPHSSVDHSHEEPTPVL